MSTEPGARPTPALDVGAHRFLDLDAEPLEDAGPVDNDFEPGNTGIPTVTVGLETLAGTPVLTGTTDATGLVTFTTRPGSYRLNLDPASEPEGLLRSPGWTNPLTVTTTPPGGQRTSVTATSARA